MATQQEIQEAKDTLRLAEVANGEAHRLKQWSIVNETEALAKSATATSLKDSLSTAADNAAAAVTAAREALEGLS